MSVCMNVSMYVYACVMLPVCVCIYECADICTCVDVSVFLRILEYVFIHVRSPEGLGAVHTVSADGLVMRSWEEHGRGSQRQTTTRPPG